MNVRKTFVIVLLSGLSCLTCSLGFATPQKSHAPSSPQRGSQGAMPSMNMPNMPGMDMSGMSMSRSAATRTEADAMRSMQPMHMHMADGPHMHMTTLGHATPADWERADQIAATLRDAIEKYKDYRVAIRDGFQIFLPNVPQSEYHFNSTWNGYLESFTFDPARPTSLLYRKTKTGWELVGAMYTAPKTDTLDQLNQRIPLGVARWHAHINLCIPQGGLNADHVDWARFGLEGSIASPRACAAAGGNFYPQIFGWMVHVYPFESTRQKIWGQE